MIEQKQLKSQLEEERELVKQRIQIFDMIEERLIRMKGLAQTVTDDLTPEEIEVISKKVKILEDEINLLSMESNLQA